MKNCYLVTGASGFLGGYLLECLPEDAITVGRGNKNRIKCDLSQGEPNIPVGVGSVVHAAGLAHTASSASEFYSNNVIATKNLLSALSKSKSSIQRFIFISSVSVYGLEEGINIDEETPTIPKTPYGLTKLIAELMITNWAAKNNVDLVILRLPLLVGNEPPGNLGRLINSIKSGRHVSIIGLSKRRSMVLASDVAELISRNALTPGIFNLTDGYHPSRFELESTISKRLGTAVHLKIPSFLALLLGKIGDIMPEKFPFKSSDYKKLTATLVFDDTKAVKALEWSPRKVLTDESW
jgi:nucleoside-diphosphate-sugar epimerase